MATGWELTDEERAMLGLAPLPPMPAPNPLNPGRFGGEGSGVQQPPLDPATQSPYFNPDVNKFLNDPQNRPAPPTSPYMDPSAPMQEASLGGGGLLNSAMMSLGQGGDTTLNDGGGGGLLSGLTGGRGMASAGKPWGPMLMALGGGIAGGATKGWGAGLGEGFTNAASVRQRGEALSQQQQQFEAEQAIREQALQAKLAEMAKGPDPMASEREFERAQTDPKYAEFLLNRAKAAASNVTVGGGKYGSIPPGYELVEGQNGASMRPIPGSPEAQKAEAAVKQEQTGEETKAQKADVMLSATKGIKDAIAGSKMPAVGPGSQYLADIPFTDTAATTVRGHVNTLKSGVALGAMMRLKEASQTGSTGFGAMNEKELQILIDDIGSLNPDGSKVVFDQTVDRIERRWKAVVEDVRKNVDPARIKELGLDELVGGGTGGGKPDPLGIR